MTEPAEKPVALVTGGVRRLGLAITTYLLDRGYTVIGTTTHPEQVPDELLEQSSFFPVTLDYTTIALDQISTELQNVLKPVQGRLDLLVNNAAIIEETPFGSVTTDQWDRLMTINLKGLFFLSQAAAGVMKQGRIINIADTAGNLNWTHYLVYSISKSGVIHLTRQMAKVLGPDIMVNAIAPGTVIPFEQATEEDIARSENLSVLKKIGSPDEITRLIGLLLDSTFITGSVFTVDGGRSLF